MVDEIKIINSNHSNLEEECDVGGDWACLLGCGTFCIIGGGYTSAAAAFTSVL